MRFGVISGWRLWVLAVGRFSGPESSYMSRDFFLDELYDIATAQE